MITTKQARSIIRERQAETLSIFPAGYQVYTNKLASQPELRTVKCYYRHDDVLLERLREAAGEANVKLTPGNQFTCREGIVVTCVLG